MSREPQPPPPPPPPPPYPPQIYYPYPNYSRPPPPPAPLPPTTAGSPGKEKGDSRVHPAPYPSASPPRHPYHQPIPHPPPPQGGHHPSQEPKASGVTSDAPPRPGDVPAGSSGPPPPAPPPPTYGQHPPEAYPPPAEGYHHHYGDAWRPIYNPPYPREHYWPPPYHHPPPPSYWPAPAAAREPHVPPVKESSDRAGATSPSQIENHHRDEVQNMGCTCKKTRCLKLYCQCFAAQLYCGNNCRCLTCNNTANHETSRKEAMRSILLRNPGAFDSKFKKTAALNVGQTSPTSKPVAASTVIASSAPTAEEAPPPATAAAPSSKSLAHKLGCKCRKSACIKKYCECYAGNVKCSSNCRCIGCKNQGNFDQQQPRIDAPPPPPYGVVQPPRRNGEQPWVAAAQNLTFLKRGSPPEKEKSAISSIPSLASSSEGTSPGDDPPRQKKRPLEDGGALLMAAVAMTEFGQNGKRVKCVDV